MDKSKAFKEIFTNGHNNGISLISLVVTIIVIIILAGVSMSMISRK